ncbi:hypothetical protein MLD38_023950 [Melastoma candidum]|uniref:Uncharacterized protein n=1 Tax=Melastoma candidum TaxID=119954 RepID=A0ACB9NR54_9MYRT|nr:hypothetical protein MLD38_023950 [Melastoma candidum]
MGNLSKIVVAALGVLFMMVASMTATLVTTIVSSNATANTYGPGNYANSVDYVLEDMATVTPNHPGYDYHTNSPYTVEVAYGHSTCNKALTFADCGTCVAAAKSLIKKLHPNSMGVEMNLQDCSMRYESYYV